MKLAYIVEDNPFYQKILEAHLQQMGYKSKSFFSAKECIAHLHTRPSLILIDQHLDKNEKGVDFIKTLKYYLPFVPIIFLSADNDGQTIAKALELGALDYIEKNDAAFVKLRTTLDRVPHYLSRQRFKLKVKVAVLFLSACFLIFLIRYWMS